MFKSRLLVPFVLFVLLGLSFFVRVSRTPDLLRFYYDQGRDAIVIAEMIRDRQPVLVGPTTGLAGILRGPAFYYLLLPAYLVGQGNPVVAAVWLQIINIFGLYIFYRLAKELFSPIAGLLAVFLMGLSAHMVDLSRWLSNPSPIMTTVPLMLYGLLQINKQNRPQFWWPVVALMLGLNLQFEMASEIWFIPVVIILALFFTSFRPAKKTAIVSVAIFLMTLVPQIAFDIRHDGIMRNAVIDNFTHQSTSSFSVDRKSIDSRLHLYADTFSYIFSPNYSWSLYLLIALFLPIFLFPKLRQGFLLPTAFLATPLLILTFFTGNSGNFYTYYLIGTFPIFLLLVAGILSIYLSRFSATIVIPIILLTVFTLGNYQVLYAFLKQGIDGPSSITIRNQLDNIDWIYKKAEGQPFNVDIYVPPVIPYSYDYLFSWYGQKTYGYQPSTSKQTLEFTLYEADSNQERFNEWFTVNTADHPVLLDKFSSGGVRVEARMLN